VKFQIQSLSRTEKVALAVHVTSKNKNVPHFFGGKFRLLSIAGGPRTNNDASESSPNYFLQAPVLFVVTTHIPPRHPKTTLKYSKHYKMSIPSRWSIRCIHLFRLPPRQTSIRQLSNSTRHLAAFKPGPAPPRLPKEEQERFEQLQKASTGAFSTPRGPPKINQSPHSTESNDHITKAASEGTQELGAGIKGDGEELHPNIRKGAKPEFEGDTNPKTGEVGGPKNEPLRWGESGDWSYNGRVTDF
jgi:hypothetical protein